MAHPDPKIKGAGDNVARSRYIIVWIDRHPRTGWYCFGLIVLNFIVDALTHLL